MTRRSLGLAALLVGLAVVGAAPALAQATASIDDQSLPLAADEQQVISGETGLEPGTELTVRLRSADSSTPFLKQQTAYVSANGTFAAVFDMSTVPANTTLDLTVLSNGTTLAEASSRTVACERNCTDTVPDLPEPPEPKPTVTVERGEVATVPISTEDSERVAFSLGGEDVNYLVNATLVDGNDDGEVRVRVDTAAAGTDGPTLTVADAGDSLSVTRPEPSLSSPLEAGAYEYRLFRGGDTATDPDGTGTLAVEAADATESFAVGDDTGFGFERSVYSSRQGAVVPIQVSLGTAETAAVVIGGRETGYQVNATVTDGNGDGTVELRFDTAAAGRSGATLTAGADADSVSVVPGSEVERDTAIDADDYDLALYRGPEASGSPDAVGTLSLQDGDVSGELSVTEAAGDSTPAPTVNTGFGALAIGGLLAVAGVAVVARSML